MNTWEIIKANIILTILCNSTFCFLIQFKRLTNLKKLLVYVLRQVMHKDIIFLHQQLKGVGTELLKDKSFCMVLKLS